MEPLDRPLGHQPIRQHALEGGGVAAQGRRHIGVRHVQVRDILHGGGVAPRVGAHVLPRPELVLRWVRVVVLEDAEEPDVAVLELRGAGLAEAAPVEEAVRAATVWLGELVRVDGDEAGAFAPGREGRFRLDVVVRDGLEARVQGVGQLVDDDTVGFREAGSRQEAVEILAVEIFVVAPVGCGVEEAGVEDVVELVVGVVFHIVEDGVVDGVHVGLEPATRDGDLGLGDRLCAIVAQQVGLDEAADYNLGKPDVVATEGHGHEVVVFALDLRGLIFEDVGGLGAAAGEKIQLRGHALGEREIVAHLDGVAPLVAPALFPSKFSFYIPAGAGAGCVGVTKACPFQRPSVRRELVGYWYDRSNVGCSSSEGVGISPYSCGCCDASAYIGMKTLLPTDEGRDSRQESCQAQGQTLKVLHCVLRVYIFLRRKRCLKSKEEPV